MDLIIGRDRLLNHLSAGRLDKRVCYCSEAARSADQVQSLLPIAMIGLLVADLLVDDGRKFLGGVRWNATDGNVRNTVSVEIGIGRVAGNLAFWSPADVYFSGNIVR